MMNTLTHSQVPFQLSHFPQWSSIVLKFILHYHISIIISLRKKIDCHIFLFTFSFIDPPCYCCPDCQETFEEPNALKAHLYLEICQNYDSPTSSITSNQPQGHKCCHCGKNYARRYSLKIHIRTHTGQKPLECRVCSRRFGDPSNLNKHLRMHGTNNLTNPYICKLCGDISARRRDLERHLRKKHKYEIDVNTII